MTDKKIIAALERVINKLNELDDAVITGINNTKEPFAHSKMMGYSNGLERAIDEIEEGIKSARYQERADEEVNSFAFPIPVERDSKQEYNRGTPPKDWFLRILDEILEAVVEAEWSKETGDNRARLAEELQDIIHVCTSYQAAIGMDFQKRQELCAKVNKKNKARGYF